MLEANPENIIRKGKAPQWKGTSTAKPSISDNVHCPSLETPILASHSPFIPSVGVSRTLNFGSVPIEFSPRSLGWEGKTLVTRFSPEIVPWFIPNMSEDFPTLGFTTPHPVVAATDEETSFPSGPLSFSSNTLLLLFPPKGSVPVSPVQTPSPPHHIPMVGANSPGKIMDSIVAARYAPLILPQSMNSLHTGDYLKYMPKFTGEEDITAEEHLAAFYSYANNSNTETRMSGLESLSKAYMVRLGNDLGD